MNPNEIVDNLENSIIRLINESGLPLSVVDLILFKITAMIKDAKSRQPLEFEVPENTITNATEEESSEHENTEQEDSN